MKVAPLNRWDFYKILGTGIIAFGLLFNSVEFLQFSRKRKKGNNTVQLGQKSRSAAGPAKVAAQRTGARARARFKPDGRGPGVRT